MTRNFLNHHIYIIYQTFLQKNLPLDLCLAQYFRTHKSLGSKDRKTIGNLFYGMIRWKSLIDFLSPEDPIEFFQSASLSELLQTPSLPQYARLGMSECLYQKFCDCLGKEKTHYLGSFLNEQAPTTIRVNLLKTSREQLLALWETQFSMSPSSEVSTAISFHKREPLFSLPEFKQGLFEVQDEGSQKIAEQIKAKPGDTVLDYCSGSGGKTLGFAHTLKGKGQIYLHDIRKKALEEAKKRLKRAGIQNAQCLHSEHPQMKKLIGKCDWVLADVPCTGTGTYRRNPDQKWKFNENVLQGLVQTQKEVATQAISYLKPGGTFVYATCSILPEENEKQVEFLLSKHPIELLEPVTSLFPIPKGRDGFFFAVFKKKRI